jgi:hypothetical protein
LKKVKPLTSGGLDFLSATGEGLFTREWFNITESSQQCWKTHKTVTLYSDNSPHANLTSNARIVIDQVKSSLRHGACSI